MITQFEKSKENRKLKVVKKRIQEEIEGLKPCKSGTLKPNRKLKKKSLW